MEIISLLIGIGTGIIGVWVSLYTFHSGINYKLDKIINKNSDSLNYEQSIILVELYLDMIQNELREKVRSYCLHHYKDDLVNKNYANIEIFVNNSTSKVIISSRNKISIFKISGGQSFKHFLDMVSPLDKSIIRDAKKNICAHLKDKKRENDTLEKIEADYLNMVSKAGRLSLEKIKKEVSKRYKGIEKS